METTPTGVILRMLIPSDTYKLFVESIVIPRGNLKLAFVPIPSIDPCDPLPAKVDTTPAGVILRMR